MEMIIITRNGITQNYKLKSNLPLANHVSMAGIDLFCHHFDEFAYLDPVVYEQNNKTIVRCLLLILFFSSCSMYFFIPLSPPSSLCSLLSFSLLCVTLIPQTCSFGAIGNDTVCTHTSYLAAVCFYRCYLFFLQLLQILTHSLSLIVFNSNFVYLCNSLLFQFSSLHFSYPFLFLYYKRKDKTRFLH